MQLIFRNLTAEKKFNSKFFEKFLITAEKEIKLKNKNTGISINLVGESRIRGLNKKYRNKDKATDVLSFPLSEKPIIHNSKFIIHDLGDIFICLSIAKKQAKSENINIEKKLARLTVHGFLHLLGYDHEKSEKDAEKMFSLEDKFLKKINF